MEGKFEAQDCDMAELVDEDLIAELFGDAVHSEQELALLVSVVNKFRSNELSKVIIMSGAGISVSAGIPDFRSPGTGLYDNLSKFSLPYPEAIFEMSFFERKPEPFFSLVRGLFPGSYDPTPTHLFIRLLQDQGKLLRNYTQNIDGLERLAGILPEKLVEAHGTFDSASCIRCGRSYSGDFVRDSLKDPKVKVVHCELDHECKFVKPDIVFFGEDLPDRFFDLREQDFQECDLLIVMGTSLKVNPFADLVEMTSSKCQRIYINKQPTSHRAFKFGKPRNKRDIFLQGSCDQIVQKLSVAFDLTENMKELMAAFYLLKLHHQSALLTHSQPQS